MSRPAQDPAPLLDDTSVPGPHRLDGDAVTRRWEVDPDVGLNTSAVQVRKEVHGLNHWPEPPSRPLWHRALEPFLDFMTAVLLAAAGVALALGEHTDALVIVVIIVVNGTISAVQSWRADRALQALNRLSLTRTLVRRDGRVLDLDARELVPGDIVVLEAGAQVPADLRLLRVTQLRIDESALTGESVTVDKHSRPLTPTDDAAEPPLGDRLNMAFKGTWVTHGHAEGVVVATGSHTELGRVAGLLGHSVPKPTPLQQRLARLGRRLSVAVLVICVWMFGLGVARGEPVWQMALTAISLAVAAIPEALPAVVTVLLALGARRMAQGQALVRRLPAVETLGSVSVIASDKTGTLTQNRMQVQQACTRLDALEGEAPSDTSDLWRAAVLCNDAQPAPAAPLPSEEAPSPDADHKPEPARWIGDPTETALLDGALRGLPTTDPVTHFRQRWPRIHDWPFDADRKRMTTLHPQDGGCLSVTKGAPESVLPRCADPDIAAWTHVAQTWATQGWRVLAFAQRSWPAGTHDPHGLDAESVERELTLLGLVALLDPPRPEAAAAVAQCRQAGIRVVMITGDHPATAGAIARQLGILDSPCASPGAPQPVVTGAELSRLDPEAWPTTVAAACVFARVDPTQKISIVRELQAQGAYVAMTGDGVNDAPALKAADIGVAMGRNGTDVAREAAALVLLDDHFATIVTAVHEGRRIFDNVRKFVRYALTGNSGEIWTLFLAPWFGLPVPLLPVHILWINLVTDGLPGLALATEPAEPDTMRRPPRPRSESLFAHGLWQHVLVVGLLMGGLSLAMQAWTLREGNPHGQTMVFTTLTLAQMAHILAIRSETVPLWRMDWRSNPPMVGAVLLTVVLQMAVLYVPPLQEVFHTHALSAAELGWCLGGAGVVGAAVELEKAWRRRQKR